MKQQFNIAIDEKYAKKIKKNNINLSHFTETKVKELFDEKQDLSKFVRNTWSKEELQYLVEKYRFNSIKNIARYLKRTESAIKTKKKELGLIKTKNEKIVLKGKFHPSWKGGPVKTKCAYCKKIIEKEQWRVDTYTNNFCDKKCQGKYRSQYNVGENHPNYKGKYKTSDGYILLHLPRHPFCDKAGYVKEHRIVMEDFLGRYITKEEVVHHVNHIRDDNRIENLMLFPSNKAHSSFHAKENFNNFQYKNGSKQTFK